MKTERVVLPKEVIPSHRYRDEWAKEFSALRLQPVRVEVLQQQIGMTREYLMQIIDVRKVVSQKEAIYTSIKAKNVQRN